MLKEGMISKKDLAIIKITDDITEVVKAANKVGHVKIDENIYDKYYSLLN
jgi:predicted Rossmann-fold nucleotide-binding protein